jgi:hypothetical protein
MRRISFGNSLKIVNKSGGSLDAFAGFDRGPRFRFLWRASVFEVMVESLQVGLAE